jgi:hypothetical protein
MGGPSFEKNKDFFFEKKKQKTFTSAPLPRCPAMAWIYPWAPEVKVFCFFSSEKKTLAFSCDGTR